MRSTGRLPRAVRVCLAIVLATAMYGAVLSNAASALAAYPEMVYAKGLEIRVANGSGGDDRAVPGALGDKPSLSPDGRQIAYMPWPDDRLLAVISVDGTAKRTVWEAPVNLNTYARWSPDGTRILFQAAMCQSCKSDIYSVKTDGTGFGALTSTPGINEELPEYSPDGTKIAYTVCDEVAWNGEWGCSAYVMESSGANQRKLFGSVGSPQDSLSAIHTAWSPDGVSLVFGGIERTTPGTCSAIWRVKLDRTDLRRLTGPCPTDNSFENYIPTQSEPSWAPDGTRIMFFERDLYRPASAPHRCYRIKQVDPTGDGETTIFDQPYPCEDASGRTAELKTASFRQIAGPGVPPPPPPPPPSDQELLDRYRPMLKYDTAESYRADHPALATDTYVSSVRTNRLLSQDKRGREVLLAVSDPAAAGSMRKPVLVLSTLTGSSATTDKVDLANPGGETDYLLDAQRMHANPMYGNKVTGRVFTNSDGSRVLQYWLFYYFNPKVYGYGGKHEGDWELLQVHLGSDGAPTAATAAQHSWGERCDWANVQRDGNDRPIVYVAEGSHATYFSSGYHLNPAPGSPEPADDHANGEGDTLVPSVLMWNIQPVASALGWKGRWGGTPPVSVPGLPDTPPSPPGPAFQGPKWTNPEGWSLSSSVKDCSEEQTQAAPRERSGEPADQFDAVPAAPTAPRLQARLRGESVVMRYRIRRGSNVPRKRPVQLLTTVDSAGKRYPPLTRRTRIRGGEVGRLVQERGRGPWRLSARVISAAGTRSEEAVVRIR